MRVLGLPGRKPSTLPQMRALLAALGFDGAPVHTYGFWNAADVVDPDISPEVAAVASSAADLVVAKSIGTLITALAAQERRFAPKACVFLAIPLRRFQALELVPVLQAHCRTVPTLVIQQTADYNGAYAQVAEIVAPHPLCGVTEIPGGDHLYEDIELIAPIVRTWLDARAA